jgi:hypothetical protein
MMSRLGGRTVSEDSGLEDREKNFETSIVYSFGSAIIEFEDVIFQKFLIMSGANSVMTKELFMKLLSRMHSKGYVAPLEFLGRKAWRRLVVEDRLEDRLEPIAVQKTSKDTAMSSKPVRLRKKPDERLVSESRVIAEDLLNTMKGRLMGGRDLDTKAREVLVRHAAGMRKALTESREGFLDYIRTNTPSMSEPMQRILNSKGEDVLLLSLRLIEAGYVSS